MTGPIEEYLRELRENLRTPPEETSRFLAEAEDHLAESVSAGLAAGLTQTEAAEAAISAFGSVRAVVRAHQTRRGRAAAVLADLGMTAWALAGVILVSVFALFGYLVLRRFQRRRGRRPQSPLRSPYSPLAGTVLFAGDRRRAG
jgi:uncharacterized membrane protein